ncbi:MAG: GtrA family protein, partial [Eubacterium sp.]
VIKYVFFGALTTLVNLVIFKVFDKILGKDLFLVTNVISWIGAVIFAYVTNKLWVFESKSWKGRVVIKELIGFFGARLFSLGVEEAGLWLMIDILKFKNMSGFELFSFKLDGNFIAKLIMQVVVVVLNYFFSKFVIFAKKKKDK